MDARFTSLRGNPVVLELDRHRERRSSEPVHLRRDEDNPTCPMCGRWADIWLPSQDRWNDHPFNCGVNRSPNDAEFGMTP